MAKIKFTKLNSFGVELKRPRYRLDQIVTYETGIEEYFEDKYYCHDHGILTILPDYVWDGATGGIDYKFLRASLIHDVLCESIGKKQLSVKYQPVADKIMKKITKEDGMFFLRRWWTYGAVRSFQYFSRKRQLKNGEVVL